MSSIPLRVSVHGGHSGQFCCHAVDSLEEVVQAYVHHGYTWVGLTEHMPPEFDRHSYPEEAEAGLSASDQYDRFARYIDACRKLQVKYASKIRLLVAFEAEAFSGYEEWVPAIREEFKPDYIVGSVHQVKDRLIDSTPEVYQAAADDAGGVDELYCAYFDRQYEVITTLSPEVISHFDLIRIYDADYRNRLIKPEIWQRIVRNLESIRDRGLIMDFNLRALHKGQPEPYISQPILKQAQKMRVHVAPGDDSHGVGNIDQFWDRGVQILREAGFKLDWKSPA